MMKYETILRITMGLLIVYNLIKATHGPVDKFFFWGFSRYFSK